MSQSEQQPLAWFNLEQNAEERKGLVTLDELRQVQPDRAAAPLR
jgi:hypothetical protein